MANKSRSKSQEAYFSRYKTANKQAANRKIKLERVQKEQPNNEQVSLALKDIHYRRGTPKEPYWSHQMIARAKLFKEFTGKFDKLAFNTDPVVSVPASKVRNENIWLHLTPVAYNNRQSMFSIHTKLGNPVWN